MSLAILFHFLCAQHVSDINISIIMLVLQASACNTNTTQNQPHQISNTQRTENKTTDVVIQQHSRKLLMMDILMSETCWAHKKSNKIARDIKLAFHSSTITMMNGPINIRFTWICVHCCRLKSSRFCYRYSWICDFSKLSTKHQISTNAEESSTILVFLPRSNTLIWLEHSHSKSNPSQLGNSTIIYWTV